MNYQKIHWFVLTYSNPAGLSPTRSLIQPCFLSYQILPALIHLVAKKTRLGFHPVGLGRRLNLGFKSCLINVITIVSIVDIPL